MPYGSKDNIRERGSTNPSQETTFTHSTAGDKRWQRFSKQQTSVHKKQRELIALMSCMPQEFKKKKPKTQKNLELKGQKKSYMKNED